jgi:hypothetical protein
MRVRDSFCAAAAALLLIAATAGAQTASPAPTHPAVCGAGVRVYHQKSDIPVPYDTVSLPPAPPIRVTSMEEAEAAEVALRERAGAAGANGVLIVEESTDEPDGNVRMHRSVTAVYAAADSAHAAAACKKS